MIHQKIKKNKTKKETEKQHTIQFTSGEPYIYSKSI